MHARLAKVFVADKTEPEAGARRHPQRAFGKLDA